MSRPHKRRFDTQIADMAALFCFTHFAIRQQNPMGAERDFRVQHARRLWRDARVSSSQNAEHGVVVRV